jgi:hypothetical protein
MLDVKTGKKEIVELYVFSKNETKIAFNYEAISASVSVILPLYSYPSSIVFLFTSARLFNIFSRRP